MLSEEIRTLLLYTYLFKMFLLRLRCARKLFEKPEHQQIKKSKSNYFLLQLDKFKAEVSKWQ